MLNFIQNSWKYWWNETDDEILSTGVSTISLNFEIHFLSFPWEIALGVISGHYLYLKLTENVKKVSDLKYLKFFWYQIFVY